MTEREFRVGTFCERRGERATRFSAYTTYYSPDWPGLVEFVIKAANGTEAKRRAIALRRIYEGLPATLAKPARPVTRAESAVLRRAILASSEVIDAGELA